MKTILLGALLATGAVLLLAHTASALKTHASDSCAHLDARSGTGADTDYIVAWTQGQYTVNPTGSCDGTGITNCGLQTTVTDANYCGLDASAHSPYILGCGFMLHTGSPAQATSVTVNVYNDVSGTVIATFTPTCTNIAGGNPNTALNGTPFTTYLTTDGTNLGNAAYGTLRLYIEAKNVVGGITQWDCNSDDAGTQTAPTGGSCNPSGDPANDALVRSSPGLTSPNATGSAPCASGCHTYTGGDTLNLAITSNASAYTTHTYATTSAWSDSGPHNTLGSAFSLATGTNTQSTTIQGTPTQWPTGALITGQWTESGGSALPGYTGLSYYIFTTQNAPAPLTVLDPNDVRWSTGDTLDRTLTDTQTAGACGTVTVDGIASTTANRGSTVVVECNPWHDARGANIVNNVPGEAWYQRAGMWEDWSDFPSVNATFGSQGNLPSSLAAKFSGCAAASGGNPPPDAIGCATTTTGLGYHKMVQTCVAACGVGDANLGNWGNSTGQFDVSRTFTIANVLLSKTNPPTSGNNATCPACQFTIGTDTENVQETGLKEQSGASISGATMICTRRFPSGATESSQNSATDASGNSAIFVYQVVTPQGKYSITCTTNFNGNGAIYAITAFHISAFTGDTANVANSRLDGNTTPPTLHIIAFLREINETSWDRVDLLFPDNASDYRFDVRGRVQEGYSSFEIATGFLNSTGPGTTAFAANVTMPANWTTLNYVDIYVWANLTGKPLLGHEQVTIQGAYIGNFLGNFNVLTALGNLTITTAFDAYIEILLWGGLFLLMLYLRAWFPATVALLNLGDSILPTPVLNLPARVMLIAIALYLHAIFKTVWDNLWPMINERLGHRAPRDPDR